MGFVVTVLLVTLCVAVVDGKISEPFRKFIREHYGEQWEADFARDELLETASYGGGDSGITKNRPVVFIHGRASWGGVFVEKFHLIADYKAAGYSDNELYTFTYGEFMEQYECHCRYVQAIRQFIVAVHEYTGKKVDVVAHSMGCILTRKAILGGRCCDTDEPVGDGRIITDLVHTFIGITCPNQGVEKCYKHKFLATVLGKSTCNSVNGLIYDSKFIQEINSKRSRYEGNHVFVIRVEPDDIIGNVFGPMKEKNRDTADIDGVEETHVITNLKPYPNLSSHSGAVMATVQEQLAFIRRHDDKPPPRRRGSMRVSRRRMSTRVGQKLSDGVGFQPPRKTGRFGS